MADDGVADLGLPRTSILKYAPAKVIQALERIAVPTALSAGETLFREGDDGDTLYAICAGSLEVSVLSSNGRKLVLDLVNAGNLIGEIAVFDPGVRTATVCARTDCALLSVSRKHLLDAFKDDPELALEIVGLISKRMRQLTEQLQEQVFLRLPERLARKILHLTADQDPPAEVLDFSHVELSEFIGTSREAVTKTLANWNQSGVVEMKRQQIRILDRSELRFLSGVYAI